jgi:hypothetical protein
MKILRYPVLVFMFLFIIMQDDCRPEKLLGGDSQDTIVARYNKKNTVTFDELKKYVTDWLYLHKFKNKSDAYHNALNDLLSNQFKRMDFFAKGYDKDKKLIKGITRNINEELVAEYFDKVYLSKYANVEFAKEIYKIMDKQVIARQIVLFKPTDSSQVKIDSLQQKAMMIKSEVDNGKNFDSLILKYSEDKQSVTDNGYMQPVDWKQSILDPVGNIVFHLNKNDVRVLNDKNAFRIVKITEINKIHLDPFDKIKDETMAYLKNVYYKTSIDDYTKYMNGLINENSLTWNENALNQLVKWSNETDFYKNKYKDTLNFALVHNDNKTILIYDKGKVDYKEYLRLLNNILILPSANIITEEDIKDFILEAIRTEVIVEKADSLDLKKNIFNPFTKNLTLKNQLATLYNQVEIEAKIPEATDEALHQFFKENENTLYYQLEKRNIFVMVFPTKDEADSASVKTKQGIPFEKVKGSYLVKTYIKERNGEINSYLSDEKPVFGKVAFDMKESEVSDPIQFKNDNQQTEYAILKCYNIRREKQLTFDDVKKSISEDFRNYYRKIIEKEVEKRLKDKFQPEIFENVITNELSSIK